MGGGVAQWCKSFRESDLLETLFHLGEAGRERVKPFFVQSGFWELVRITHARYNKLGRGWWRGQEGLVPAVGGSVERQPSPVSPIRGRLRVTLPEVPPLQSPPCLLSINGHLSPTRDSARGPRGLAQDCACLHHGSVPCPSSHWRGSRALPNNILHSQLQSPSWNPSWDRGLTGQPNSCDFTIIPNRAD